MYLLNVGVVLGFLLGTVIGSATGAYLVSPFAQSGIDVRVLAPAFGSMLGAAITVLASVMLTIGRDWNSERRKARVLLNYGDALENQGLFVKASLLPLLPDQGPFPQNIVDEIRHELAFLAEESKAYWSGVCRDLPIAMVQVSQCGRHVEQIIRALDAYANANLPPQGGLPPGTTQSSYARVARSAARRDIGTALDGLVFQVGRLRENLRRFK